MRVWIRFKRFLRYTYLRIIRLRTSAHSIAMGLAVGIFIGFLPIIPFQTIAALALALPLRGNKIAAAAGTWISNWANLVPFYAMLYYVGRFLLPLSGVSFDPEHLSMRELLDQGWQIFTVMTVGGVVLGIPGAIITYVLTLRGVLAYRRRRAMRLLERRVRLQ